MTRIPTHLDLEIEPLSERSWHRVEDRVFAQLDGTEQHAPLPAVVDIRPARWRTALTFGGFAAAAAAAAVAVVALTSPGGSPSEPLRTSRVETGSAPSTVTHGEASLVVASESALVLSGDDERGLLVVLERGRVDCSVPPRRGRPPFAVQAGEVRIEVIGTRFAVSREQDTATVEVTEGIVNVIADGEATRVRAGERWPAARTAAVIPEEPEPELELTMDPLSLGRRKPARRQQRVSEPIELPPALEPAPTTTAKQRWATAQTLETSDPNAAAAIYRELARGSGPWAANALYAHAELEARRGHQREAGRLARRYLERFPDGPNAADARRLVEASR